MKNLNRVGLCLRIAADTSRLGKESSDYYIASHTLQADVAVTLQTCIREVLASNISRYNRYPLSGSS
jgi:hypothetical protein